MAVRFALFLGLALTFLALPAAAQWMPATAVADVNSTASDFGPSPSQDGLTLHFTSNRTGGTGGFDIYRATRAAPYDVFTGTTEVMELNSTATDAGPEVRGDELEIFFYSNRAGGTGSTDIWRATRPNTASAFSVPTPVTEVNSTSSDHGPSITADGLLLYFTSGRTGGMGGFDIWLATRPDVNSPFGAPAPVTELNTSGSDRDPKISSDGLSIFWSSARTPGAGGTDVWMASRLHRVQPFTNFVNLGNANSTGADVAPGCWALRDEVFFCSTRAGGLGSYDIWSTRFIGLTAAGAAGPGKTQTLSFSDPTSPGRVYVAAASFGSIPGIPVGTRTLPLNPDDLFFLSVGGLPPYLNGYLRLLGPNGTAQGTITFPNNPAFTGIKFFNAFAVFDSTAPQGIKTISNAHEVLTQQ